MCLGSENSGSGLSKSRVCHLLSCAFRPGLTRPSQGPLLSKFYSNTMSVFTMTYFKYLILFRPIFLSALLQINLTATLGTLNVAAEVDGVRVKGDGEMHMTLSSSLLPNLNRQLQFVTYTNTLFHPSTADTGEASKKHLPLFVWSDL